MAIKKRDVAIEDFNRKINRLEREYREVKGENSKIKGYLGVLSSVVIVLAILSVVVINLTGFSIFNEGGNSLEVVHYSMNDNAADANVVDSSGNSHTGTATTVTSSLTTPGKIGKALNFGGNYITVGDSTTLFSSSSWSFSFWAYPTNVANYEWFSKRTNGVGDGLSMVAQSGNWLFYADGGGSSWDIQNGLSFGTATANQWQMITVVKDGSNWNLYLNGVLSGSSFTNANNIQANGQSIVLGGGHSDTNNALGKMDDFRVYSVALTQDQITALYNSTSVTGGAEVAHWTLNDNDIDAYVDDSSGNGYTGTAQQATNTITTSGKINSALPFSGAVSAACSGDHSACSTFIASGDAVCTSHSCSWLGMGDCSASWGGDQTGCESHQSSPYNCAPGYGADPGTCACAETNTCACYSGCGTNPNNCACGDPNNCACSDSSNCACYPEGDPNNCGGGTDPCETNTCTCYPSGNPNNCACGDPGNCACSDPNNCACYCPNPNNCPCGAGPFTGCSGTWGDNCYDSPHACSTLGSDACVADSGNGCTWTDAVSDKHIVVSYNDALNPATISVCAWVKTSASYSGWGGVVTLGNSAWRLLVSGTNNGGVQAGAVDFGTNGLSSTDTYSNSVVGDNAWHYVCGVFDGSTKYIYVDGSLDTSASVTGSIPATTADLWIGANSGTSQAFTGNIDDVRLYNYALSASQVSALYSNSSEDSLTVGLTAPMGTEANLAATVTVNPNSPAIAHYKMNDNAASTTVVDSSGNGYTGTAGTTTNVLTTTGKIGSALNVTGKAVNLSNSVHFMSSDFSIAMWIKADSWADVSNILIRSHQSSGDQNGDIVLGLSADGTICFSGLDVSSNWVFGYAGACTLKTSALNTGQWYHVVAERSGTNYSIYVDGVLNNSDTSSANWNDASNTHELAISGQTFPALPYGLNGLVDDVRIYNYSLNSSQIAFIYNSGTGTENELGEVIPTPPMQVLHYKMNDNAASTKVIDSSNFSYNGTATANTDTLTTTGKINSALTLNGNSVDAGRSFAELSSGNFSASVWFNTTQNDYVDGVFSNGGPGTYHSMYLTSYHVSFNSMYFAWFDSTNTEQTFKTSIIPSENVWHNVIIIKEGTNMSMYYDGAAINSTITTLTLATPTNNMKVGTDGYGNNMNGIVDDFRIYNYALNSSDIAFIYNSGAGTENEIGVTAADTNAPAIFIIHPQQNANYSTRTLALNYSVFDDTAMGSCWYSFDAGMTMQPAQVCGTNWTGLTALTALDEGNNRWTVYANDTAGNTNSTDVFFYVDSLAPNTNFTNPTSSGTVNGNAIYVNLSTSDANEHYSFLDFDNSLSLWYRMDNVNASGDPVDSSKYSVNGTKKASAVQTNSGKFGKGFDLSASTTSYIELSRANFNNPTTQITVSAWIYGNEFTNYNRIVARDGWSNAGNYSWIMYTDQNNRSIFGVSNGTTLSGPASSINSLNRNTWYHLVGTYNGTLVTIYVDGVKNASLSSNANTTNIVFTPVSSYLRIGSATADSHFNGTVDEVMIFNRSLSAAEVASLYSATASQYSVNFTGLGKGSHSFIGYSVDSFGNKNSTETRTVTLVDTTSPSVSIIYPVNASYSSSSLALNYSASDETALGSCWYSLNGGANSTAQTCNTNWTGLTGTEGSNSVFVYANDSSGNIGFSSLTFIVDLTNPRINFSAATSSGTLVADAIYVNLTTSDTNNHYSFLDFGHSLIGWWRGEGNALDDIGLHNASWVGTSIYGAGKFGNAFRFNTANGYVNTSHVFNDSTFSASVWFKANSLVNGSNILNNGFYSTDTSANGLNRSWQLRLGWGEGAKLMFCLGNRTDGNCLGNSSNYLGLPGYLSANNWYNVVVVYNGSNGNTSLYLNGVMNWSDSRPNMDIPTEALIIGKDPGVGTNTIFDGFIDDVLLFNRTLTSAEVASLYNSQSNRYEKNFSSLAFGSYTFKGYAIDSAGNKNSTETRTVTLTFESANTGLPSCLAQNCTEGASCVITSACHLDSSMCSGGICQFTNFTISAQLKTGTNDSGTAKDLAINITSTASSPVLFLSGGAINFSGNSGTVGGSAGIVNITVYNLFNTTSAFFYGTGGSSSTTANGGNGGILQLNYNGLIRKFSDFAFNQEDNDPEYNEWLNGGSSNGGASGSAGGIVWNKNFVCTSTKLRDVDVDGNGLVSSSDYVVIIQNYNDKNGVDAGYTQSRDINCDNNLNVIEVSRIGLKYNTR